ncbi:MAG: cysteine--tRNA ligase [Candidatus Portnoybacteria bacterium RBG_13_40_8]|uniref:Cysteine--tRNA ligase n=1 Tax=Candidatus Portnoybacteria bacterium RBG_13_40_8 TaxID=1801990 RepID=A0A1G2F4U9_9BACT|nr:MAG: cysteine--tRNA ligase [Candidatus Portnoybacteria bacterium RBG_13_40_8]
MALKLYNTLTRKKEIFKPIKNKTVGIYTCGPTVYSYQHIGNLRSYVFADTLKKVLFYNGYKVKHVMNVTDVGHLSSDADTGEDKIEKAAQKEKKTASEITEYYWKIFKDDFKKLNIIEPDIWSKATDHIKEQIELIKKLEKNGYTYKTNDGIYFNTAKLKNYGELAQLKKQKLQAGKRIKLGEKKNITDFALWKFSEKPGTRQQEWQSPWGIGFPGWHIECSAMSMEYLGERFDIHTGGIDHISIHHTNEIAQNQVATGHRVVNFWMHGAFLTFKGEKVSKSKGGLYTISELEEKGFSPLAYRYLLLTAHYRSPLEFSLESLKKAQEGYERLKNIIGETRADGKINNKYLDDFNKTINDDLDIPKAMSVLWKLLRDKKAMGKIKTIKEMDRVFGLDLLKKEEIKIPKEIKKLVKERENARKNKDWKKSDELRTKIKSLGYWIEDTGKGAKVKKI